MYPPTFGRLSLTEVVRGCLRSLLKGAVRERDILLTRNWCSWWAQYLDRLITDLRIVLLHFRAFLPLLCYLSCFSFSFIVVQVSLLLLTACHLCSYNGNPRGCRPFPLPTAKKHCFHSSLSFLPHLLMAFPEHRWMHITNGMTAPACGSCIINPHVLFGIPFTPEGSTGDACSSPLPAA